MIKIDELIPDDKNANRGTKQGQQMLQDSISRYGVGRSILIDKNNRIIGGNKTAEAAGLVGVGDVIIVETDGTKLVAVKRTDLDLDDSSARMLAYADNRVGELSLDWDMEQIMEDTGLGFDLSGMFDDDFISKIAFDEPTDDEWGDAFESVPEGERSPFQQMTFTLHDEQVEQVKEAMAAAKSMGAFDSPNENSNGNALARVCEVFNGRG